ncbi:MAG TPA: penicillin-binding protein 2 [Candidatus Saccharimonadales bacterium]|nr:penicillin-binding protein 2 [Candidatus Saccharimonadales bacterium]
MKPTKRQMIRPGHLRRLLLLALFIGLVYSGLGARLVFLQVVGHDKYRKISENNTSSFALREPKRGDILDINGNPLATTFPIKRVFANPSFLGKHYVEAAHALAPLLNYTEGELLAKLNPLKTNQAGLVATNFYVNLHRKVSLDQWQDITQAMAQITLDVDETRLTKQQKRAYAVLKRKAIYASDDLQRVYPSKNLAAHVIGFIQETEKEFNNAFYTEVRGVDGVERWLDNKLQGVRGWRVTETDNRKQEITIYREQEVEPRPGLNVVLTIDMVIQNIVEQQLAEVMKKHTPISASSMVVRPATGEILAMATLPNYDPNLPSMFKPDVMRNRIISDMAEPGSTFKIVVVSSALNDGITHLSDTFDCENGAFHYMGKILRDHEHYPILTVEEIVAKSSNIGAAKIGIKMGEERLYKYIRAFGFGTPTGVGLGGEVRGDVHDVKNWDKLAISRIPMGQGIAATQIQMMMAMCAIANGGRLMRPMLVERLEDQNRQVFAQYHPQMTRQVISETASRQLVQALKRVTSTNGTAIKARMEHFTVAGKTGTAQKAGGGRYLDGKYYSSFIGFFPADAPELCISVVLDEPKNGHYGGQTAAPFFKAIAEQAASYLKIKPEREEVNTTDVIASAAEASRVNTASARTLTP